MVCDYEDLLRGVNQVVQSYHTWVPNALEHGYLTLGCLPFHRVCQSVLLINFHSILYFCLTVHA